MLQCHFITTYYNFITTSRHSRNYSILTIHISTVTTVITQRQMYKPKFWKMPEMKSERYCGDIHRVGILDRPFQQLYKTDLTNSLHCRPSKFADDTKVQNQTCK